MAKRKADPAACAARVKDEELRAMRAQPVPWPYESSDQSAAAMAWRNLSSVSWALQWLDDSLHLRGEAQGEALMGLTAQLVRLGGADMVSTNWLDWQLARV